MTCVTSRNNNCVIVNMTYNSWAHTYTCTGYSNIYLIITVHVMYTVYCILYISFVHVCSFKREREREREEVLLLALS